MKLRILFLLGAIVFGANFVSAQSDQNAKNLYFGYKPRTDRRATSSVTTTTQITSTTTVSSTTRRSDNATQRQSRRANRDNTAGRSNDSSGVSPVATGLPGTKVTIELMRNDKLSFVRPTHRFRSGDKIRIRMKTNFEGYVSVLNLGSSGKVNLLYPVQNRDNFVKPTEDYQIPQGDGWIVFDNKSGTEIVSVIMSEYPLDDLAGLDRNSEYFIKDRTSKDLFVQTSGNDFYAVFREQEQGRNVGFTLRLRHGK